MAWISLTEADVLTVLSEPELTAYRSKATATGQADPLTPVLAQVTELVRGYIGAHAANRLGPDSTLPDELRAPALDLVALRLPQRVNLNPKEGRAEAAKAAFNILEAVARGEFALAAPDTTSDEMLAAATPQIAARHPEYQREQQEGL